MIVSYFSSIESETTEPFLKKNVLSINSLRFGKDMYIKVYCF